MDRNDLGKKLKLIADDFWKSKQKPILVSDLPTQLIRLAPEIDYKSVLGTQSMKSFIKGSSAEFAYQLIEHPTQQAKLGLAPADVQFSFPVEPKEEKATEGKTTKGEREGIALMRSLSKLSDSDLEKISIPVSVLVKFFR